MRTTIIELVKIELVRLHKMGMFMILNSGLIHL